jgi:hypothetical protein
MNFIEKVDARVQMSDSLPRQNVSRGDPEMTQLPPLIKLGTAIINR